MKKFKHTKYKNTGIIFELLSKQVASDVLSARGNSSLNIIKKYFKEGTELSKELACYRALTETINKKEPVAAKLIDLVLEQYKKIDSKKLRQEKFKLIGEMREAYALDMFFDSRVSNYKLLASIYKLLEFNSADNPGAHVECYDTILEHLTSSPKAKSANPRSLYEQQDPEIQKLAFKLIVEKFNDKYQFLNTKQKALISRYINENTSLEPFKNFVITEAVSIKKQLLNLSKIINDSVLKIKVNEAANLADHITSSKRIKDEHISSMLKYYELIEYINLRKGSI